MTAGQAIRRCVPLVLLLVSLVTVVPLLNAEGEPPWTVFVTLDPGVLEPVIDVDVIARADRRWELWLKVTGFDFSDLCTVVTGGRPIGHAHIYVDDRKVATAYEPYVSLAELSPGDHMLRIVLRAQDHRALLGASGVIEKTLRIRVT